MREQAEQQHQRKEEREEQRGLHDGLDEQVRRPLRRGNGGIGHALCHAVDGVVGDAEALERVERFAEQIAQLVGQQSASAQVAVLRGQRVGRNVALKLLKHSLLHLGIDEVGDRLDEHCGEQRRADERDHHAHERHQAADKALARAEKREHRQHGSQDEINDKCIIHAFHLPFK